MVRTIVRASVVPKPDIEAVNRVIDGLAGKYFQVSGGAEPSYYVMLRGLLASRWGVNALEVIDRMLALLRTLKTDDPSLFRYSWGTLRKANGWPRKMLSLVYISITQAKLGNGLFTTEGDSWWSTPPDLDEMIDGKTTLDYVRGLATTQVPPSTTPVSREAGKAMTPGDDDTAKKAADAIVARVGQLLEPDAVPAVRLQHVFERLTLHPVIRSASEKLFGGGHFREAALNAGIALIDYVKEKSGRKDLDGVSLMTTVFSVDNPTLTFSKRKHQSEKNEQLGHMYLFAGAVLAVRNPRAHGLQPDSPEESLDAISFFSFLAKRLDRATKRTPRRRGRAKKVGAGG
jgi:uncharacterized protein (TIGR02391 family)